MHRPRFEVRQPPRVTHDQFVACRLRLSNGFNTAYSTFIAGEGGDDVVEFPSGYAPPSQGSTVTRDEQRPYEITEVRKQSDGQLNVFVREIMQ